jgi:hypothetical protein
MTTVTMVMAMKTRRCRMRRPQCKIRFVPPFIIVSVDRNLYSILLVNDDFILMSLKEYVSTRAWEGRGG